MVFPVCDRSGAPVALNGRFLSVQGEQLKTQTIGTKSHGTFMAPALDKNGNSIRPLDAPTLIVTEAPIDALTLAVVGHPAIACIGTSGPHWLHLACGLKRVLLAFDADEAGDDAATSINLMLKPHGARCERLRPQHGKDWNEVLQAVGTLEFRAWLDALILPGSPSTPGLPKPNVITRPDLRESLNLPALDLDPPEDAPTNPAWETSPIWVRDLGLWQRCAGIVVTTATRPNWLRYHEAKMAMRAGRASAVDVGSASTYRGESTLMLWTGTSRATTFLSTAGTPA